MPDPSAEPAAQRPIIVAGTIELVDGEGRADLIERTVPLQSATREQEPGCLAYCFAPDPVRPNVIQVFELWADQASLAAHFEHRNYHDMRTLLRSGGIAVADNRKYLVGLAEPVYDGSGIPRADFFTAQ